MPERLLIGLDAGTTAVKGILLDEIGKIHSLASVEYDLEYPGPDLCEVNPDVYWKSVVEVIHSLIAQSNCIPENINALAFSSQGETLICVDKEGIPVRKALVWLDNRSITEADIIKNTFGENKVLGVTGQPEILPIWTATKILWLKKHEKSIFKKVHKFQLVEDHLTSRLTGKYFTNASMVTSTLYFNILQHTWWDEMTGFLGIRDNMLPEIIKSGQVVGELTDKAARETRLGKSTLVVSGTYDHAAGALGTGNITEGMVSETTGTALAMCVTLDKPILSKELNLPCQCHSVDGKYFLLPYGQTAGMVLRWFRDEFCREEIQIATRENKNTYELMTSLAEKVPPGSDGLIILPHLMGAGSPEFDVRAKGVFAGFTPRISKGHFIRAIMEAVASMVKKNLDPMTDFGIKFHEIRAHGGGSESDLWNQIKADITGIPYVTTHSSEAACLGAAILAGVGCKVFSSIEDGCTRLVRLNKKYIPDPANKEVYQKMYQKYIELYEHMKGWW
jgi:sugar (pentulose or hexulose) kinase